MQCNVHNEPMIERDGQWGKYWSHKTTDTNYPKGYCNGKAPKPQTDNGVQSQTLDVILNKLIKLEEGQKKLGQMIASIGGTLPVEPKNTPVKDLPF